MLLLNLSKLCLLYWKLTTAFLDLSDDKTMLLGNQSIEFVILASDEHLKSSPLW